MRCGAVSKRSRLLGSATFWCKRRSGRTVVVILSVTSIFFLAVLTAFVVNYCSEAMRARRDQSVSLFVDRLEHLPDLSTAELEELSNQVKELRKRRA